MLQSKQDAYGHLILDYISKGIGYEIAERDDGFISISTGPKAYFEEFKHWSLCEKRLIRLTRGKTLDVGCGAGRVALHLQKRGLDVVAIDISPLAIRVCKRRGVKKPKLLSLSELTPRHGIFDSIVMFGNTLCLLGNPRKAGRLLRGLGRVTADKGVILAQMRDPYQTSLREHLEYHEMMRRKGRAAGQSRIRIRYKRFTTPWIEYLMLSQLELEALVSGTGWRVKQFIDGKDGLYGVVLQKCSGSSG